MKPRKWSRSRSVVVGVTLLGLPLCAAAQTDPSGAWRTWHSEHFRIHAQVTLAPLVPRLAAEAERAHRLLASELVAPRGRIDLVLADNVDAANGAATPFPSNRVIVFATPPVGTTSLVDYDDWFRLVVVHELTHIFHFDPANGVWRVLRAAFGRAPYAFPTAYQPAWVSEGLATYYESRFSTAGRTHGLFHRQMLGAADAAGWPRPGDVTLASPKWPAGFGPYAWGAEFFRVQSAAHGDSVIPAFVRRSAGRLWPFAVSPPLQGAGGESLRDGWVRLRARVTEERRGRDRATVLARGLRNEPRPMVSPDGRRVAFVETDGRRVEHLVVIASDDATRLHEIAVHAAPTAVWLGDTLIFVQLELTSPVTVRSDLYRWAPGAGGARRLTRSERVDLPFVTPAGTIAAVDLARGAGQLAAFRADGRRAGSVAAPPADAWGRVALSPDGTRYAGARHAEGRWNLVVWPADAPQRWHPATDDAHVVEDPAWTPDGTAVLFASDRTGLPQIHRYELATGLTSRITDAPFGAREPAPLPDGTLIYSTLYADGFALVSEAAPVAVPSGEAAARPRTPFAPAPPVALDSSGYRPWPALRPHFWIPFGHDAGVAGTFLGAATWGSDAIGRTAYGALLGVAGDPLRIEGAITAQHVRWRHVVLDGSAEQTWDGFRVLLGTGEVVPVAERTRSGSVGATARLRRWRSAVALRIGGEIEDLLRLDSAGGVLGRPSTRIGGVLAVRGSRVEQPALGISPENGGAASAALRRRWLVDGGAAHEMQGALTGYLGLPLPGFAHWVLAARVAGGRSGGAFPSGFSVGGVSSDLFEVVPGVSLGSGRRSFPLRGYPRRGGFTRVTVTALELRVPLLLLSTGIWRLPLVLDRVSATAFAEAGGGWRTGQAPAPLALRDVGGEAVLDLGVAYDVPLRVRVGGAVPLVAGLGVTRGDPRWYVAFGPAF